MAQVQGQQQQQEQKELEQVEGYDISTAKDPEVAKKLLECAKCGICHKLARKVVELSCEQHSEDLEVPVYCEGCLKSYMAKNNNQCPSTHHPNASYHLNRPLRRQIAFLEVVCPNSDKQQSNEQLRVPFSLRDRVWNVRIR